MKSSLKILPALLMLCCGCSACRGGENSDGDGHDAEADERPDGEEVEAGEESSDLPAEGAEDETVDVLPDLDADLADVVEGEHPECPGDPVPVDLVPVAPARPPMPCGEGCRQVTFSTCEIWYGNYDVYGDRLVFNNVSESGVKQIVLVDLTTLSHYILDETDFREPERPANSWVTVWEDTIIFSSKYNVEPPDSPSFVYRDSLVKIDLEMLTRQCIRIFDYPAPEGCGPDSTRLSGSKAVWWDDRTNALGGENVYIFDILTREEKLVSDHCCTSGYPEIFGNKVVYSEGISGSGKQVWIYDVVAGTTRQLTVGDWDHWQPDIYDNKVVWMDGRRGGTAISGRNADVYMMDIVTGTETLVTDNPAARAPPPAIWGDRIAYADCRGDPENPDVPSWADEIDIYVKDISTGMETQITSLPGVEMKPLLFEKRLYFIADDLEGIPNVFEVTLE